jgi:branched-chain amino acid transport system ATP-binding protein
LPNAAALLETVGLSTGYGKKQVLWEVSIRVAESHVLAMIGPNGSGKSTFLRAVFGLLPIWNGRVRLGAGDIPVPAPGLMLRSGVALVPQAGRVFSGLTVLEHLQLGGMALRDPERLRRRIEEVLDIFPALGSRLKSPAWKLSGGEKQMLSVSLALVRRPKLMLLDEPSLGFAPTLVRRTLSTLRELNRNYGMTMLVVEQKVREVLGIADEVVVLRNGRVAFYGQAEDLARNEERLREVYL